MLPPVICMSCGRQYSGNILDKFNAIKEERSPQTEINKKNGIITYNTDITYADFFDENGIKRLCCRTHMTTYVRLDGKIS